MAIPTPKLESALKLACAEARKWLGATLPNPPVGAAALDAEGKVLAVAAHQQAGREHAEAALLKICRDKNLLSKVETMCVTLEPCNHHGKTPPCTDAIIASGIKHVVIGTRDPNPNVKGGGIEKLRENGIDVVVGVNEAECQQLIHAFAYFAKTGKPWITVKRAFDKKGLMIPPPGQKTFTSQSSLIMSHQLRKKADVIFTGSGTILADNPLFTTRNVLDYLSKRRWLAIMDRRNRVPESYLKAAHERGFNVVVYQDIATAIDDLASKGACDILVEAGPSLSKAMLDYQLWVMSVTIRQGDPDDIAVEFNSKAPVNFDTKAFNWTYFLPA